MSDNPQEWRKHDKHRETPIGVRLTNDDLTWLKRRKAETGSGFSALISNIVHEYRMQSEQLQSEQLQSEQLQPEQNVQSA